MGTLVKPQTIFKFHQYFALAGLLSLVERLLIHQKDGGSIPSWGIYGRQLINVSL